MIVASAAQMREMDRQTIEDYHVPSLVLMENAALRVVDEIVKRYGPLKGKRIDVVCGKGNNGGDGLAIARHLSTRFGAEVMIWLFAHPLTLSSDAAANFEMAKAFHLRWQTIDPEAMPYGDEPAANLPYLELRERSTLVIDALFGTGLKAGVEGAAARVIETINGSPCPIVSVDVPSGLNADTGQVEGACVQARLTVTFALPKYGLLVYPGAEYVGELVVADIGIPDRAWPEPNPNGLFAVYVTEPRDIADSLPAREESEGSNKGTFGHAFVFAGSAGMIGAAVMSSEAAARGGAGLVTLVVPEAVQPAVMGRVSPVVMTRGLPGQSWTGETVEAALALAAKGKAAAIGPGLGGADNPDTRSFVREFVSRCPVPLVIDADALNCLAQEPDHGASILQSRTEGTILTPHPGEMGRLMGTDTKTVQADRRQAVEQAAQTFGCTVLLKGSRTLVATWRDNSSIRDNSGILHINTTGNAGMGTGGAGDVLTGLLAALLAQGLEPHAAAAAGAYLHGRAGDLAASDLGGKAGLIATDLIERLPRALARCQEEATAL